MSLGPQTETLLITLKCGDDKSNLNGKTSIIIIVATNNWKQSNAAEQTLNGHAKTLMMKT